MRKMYFVLVLFSLQSFIFAQSWEWQWQNSKPVGNALYDVAALSSTRVVAFGTAGVELISTDAGETWTRNIADASRRDIWNCYFFNSTTGFIVGSGGLIMKTIDGGNTWVSKTSNTSNILYDIEFFDANNGIAVGSAGTVDRTADGGETWTVATSTGAGSLYKVCIVNSTIVYAGNSSSTPGYLLKSTNFGQSFLAATPAQITSAVYGMYAADADHIWAATSSNGIVATANATTTNTWAVQQADANTIYDVKFINSTTAFAVDAKGFVLATTNTGGAWASTQLSTIKQVRAVSYNSSDIYLVGNCGNIYKSTNTGTSWAAKYTTVTQEQLRKVIFKGDYNGWTAESPSSGNSKLLATADGGQTWSTLYTFPYPVYSISMPTNTTWYVSCSNNAIYKSTNGGGTFNLLTVPTTGATFWCMAFADSLNGYAGAASGKFIKTIDGGANWTDISTALNFGTQIVESISIITKDILYVSGLGAKLAKTTNGGTSFTALSPGILGSFFSVKFKDTDANIGLVASFSSPSALVSRTTDAGATWNPITLPTIPGGSIWDFCFSGGSNVWFATTNGDMLYSTDNGATFNLGNRVISNIIYNFAASNNNIWGVGAEGSIIKGYANPITLTLTLNSLIEAMYVAGGTAMLMTPSVTVELHDGTTKALVESKTATLSTAGVGSFTFTTAGNGTPYYIVVKSLNTVETWSAIAQSFTSGSLTYDFTTGLVKAYTDGSNPPLALHSGKYCIYSGDVNQDGYVTGDDYTGVDNDNTNFGYHVVNDVNGDGYVTGDDYTFIDNNNAIFVQRQVPPGAPAYIAAKHIMRIHVPQKSSVKK